MDVEDHDDWEEPVADDEPTEEEAFLSELAQMVTVSRPEFHVETEEDADWVAYKIAQLMREKEDRKRAYIQKQKELDRKIAFFQGRFGAELEEFARERLMGQRTAKPKKSFKLASGIRIGFREQKFNVVVFDAKALAEFCELSGEKGLVARYEPVISKEAVNQYALETGEILPGTYRQDAGQKFYIEKIKG